MFLYYLLIVLCIKRRTNEMYKCFYKIYCSPEAVLSAVRRLTVTLAPASSCVSIWMLIAHINWDVAGRVLTVFHHNWPREHGFNCLWIRGSWALFVYSFAIVYFLPYCLCLSILYSYWMATVSSNQPSPKLGYILKLVFFSKSDIGIAFFSYGISIFLFHISLMF